MPDPHNSEPNLFERLNQDFKESGLKAKEQIESLARSVSAERLFVAVTSCPLAHSNAVSRSPKTTLRKKSAARSLQDFRQGLQSG
jgi:hypothetical protein